MYGPIWSQVSSYIDLILQYDKIKITLCYSADPKYTVYRAFYHHQYFLLWTTFFGSKSW